MRKTIAQKVIEAKRQSQLDNEPVDNSEGYVFDSEGYNKAQEPVDAIFNEIKEHANAITELSNKLLAIDENFKYEVQEIQIAAGKIVKESTY